MFCYTLFPNVIAPAFLVLIVLGAWLPAFKDKLLKTVLILTAITFAFQTVFSLYQYEYISFGIPHWISVLVLVHCNGSLGLPD